MELSWYTFYWDYCAQKYRKMCERVRSLADSFVACENSRFLTQKKCGDGDNSWKCEKEEYETSKTCSGI